MKPPEGVRRWLSDMTGIEYGEDDFAEQLGEWDMLSRALAAVNESDVPREAEPATQMYSSVFPPHHSER